MSEVDALFDEVHVAVVGDNVDVHARMLRKKLRQSRHHMDAREADGG